MSEILFYMYLSHYYKTELEKDVLTNTLGIAISKYLHVASIQGSQTGTFLAIQ